LFHQNRKTAAVEACVWLVPDHLMTIERRNEPFVVSAVKMICDPVVLERSSVVFAVAPNCVANAVVGAATVLFPAAPMREYT
jgi:hypothetical protein